MALRPPGVVEMEPVREFTGDPRALARSVLQELERQRQELISQLSTIRCKSFDEYQGRFGKIEGLDIAINICKEVQRKLEA